eukprot:PLAT1230.1.p1 GENE.PLAT1230.1~~PLAT1230.1.p1  ORF type:complete len:334 (-),score=77.80 PLAT1230.1:185-1186(-)
MNAQLAAIVRQLRLPPVRFVAAYGSAVFKQAGYGKHDAPMMDILIAVDDALNWHVDNLANNSDHYAFPLRLAQPSTIASFQRDYGAAMYYNTDILAGEQRLKYGVIQAEDLVDDLLHWRWLYAAGRMHKPVAVLQSDEEVLHAAGVNLRSALAAAVLLADGGKISRKQLFCHIAGLSYLGDPRMGVAENPHKVSNIVTGSLPHFHSLYGPVLSDMTATLQYEAVKTGSDGDKDAGTLYVHADAAATAAQLVALPLPVRERIAAQADVSDASALEVAVSDGRLSRSAVQAALQRAVGDIVGQAARVQSLKGLATAGLVTSVKYVGEKIGKRLRG